MNTQCVLRYRVRRERIEKRDCRRWGPKGAVSTKAVVVKKGLASYAYVPGLADVYLE